MSKRTYIIAEIGVNHNGSLNSAKELIDVAVDAGADAVKFQTFFAHHIATEQVEKAAYQKHTDSHASQRDMLHALELSRDDHFTLKRYAEAAGIDFLSSPFGLEELAFLTDELGLTRIKIASGELSNAPLLYETARKQCATILSTGMASMDDIDHALNIMDAGYRGIHPENVANHARPDHEALKERVSLLQCTSLYPCPSHHVHLNAITTLQQRFTLPVGFSDHTESIYSGAFAVTKGAGLLEKHITYDNAADGPDHQASLMPEAFKEYVALSRLAETMLGSEVKEKQGATSDIALIAEKYIVAKNAISKGDVFSSDNLKTIRNGGLGTHAKHFFALTGTIAQKDYEVDEPILSEAES